MTIRKFDASFVLDDQTPSDAYSRYGQIWTLAEKEHLGYLIRRGHTLQVICKTMGRPPSGVIEKAIQGRILRNRQVIGKPCIQSWLNRYEYDIVETDNQAALEAEAEARASADNPQPETEKETNVNITIIEAKTLINGKDAADMSDEAIFTVIAAVEKEVEKLQGIKAKSSKLDTLIAARQKTVADLVTYVDGRA